jgi:hypothetical protein
MMTAIGTQVGQFIERNQAEEALRQSEALQRIALNAAGMGAWDWNIVTGEEKWSCEVELIYGWCPIPLLAPMKISFALFTQTIAPASSKPKLTRCTTVATMRPNTASSDRMELCAGSALAAMSCATIAANRYD